MIEHSALAYCDSLSNSLNNACVTDYSGKLYSLNDGAELAVNMILQTKDSAKKVMLAGNGGSASVVSHVQNDLCKAVGAKSLVFTEQPLLTAFANDEGYGAVFQKPIELWSEIGDLVITVSSSGASENILRALDAADAQGCQTMTFSGFSPQNPSRCRGNLNFYVPSEVYGIVETAHMAILHYLTDKAMAVVSTKSETHK